MVGVEAAQPVLLLGPEVRMSGDDLNISIGLGGVHIRVGLPVGTAGNFLKAEIGIEFDGAGVVIADMQPDGGGLFTAGMLHGTLGEDAPNAAPPMIGVGCDVGNEIDALTFIAKGNEAGVADDLVVFLPDVAGQRQGCSLCHVVCPIQEFVITTGAAHIGEVALTVLVHGGREAQLDQICDGREITQHIKRPHLRMFVHFRRECDGTH